ncbi:hypothetical protein HDU96_006069 [Phlyctochytrium bullatum]|nr:hypothetical protein HDU96_006069 [Phlyctochytrium bullatum]
MPRESDEKVLIKIDILIGKVHFKDEFFWPLYPTPTVIASTSTAVPVTPLSQLDAESFAHRIVTNNGLSLDFAPRIAAEIRAQVCAARLNGGKNGQGAGKAAKKIIKKRGAAEVCESEVVETSEGTKQKRAKKEMNKTQRRATPRRSQHVARSDHALITDTSVAGAAVTASVASQMQPCEAPLDHVAAQQPAAANPMPIHLNFPPNQFNLTTVPSFNTLLESTFPADFNDLFSPEAQPDHTIADDFLTLLLSQNIFSFDSLALPSSTTQPQQNSPAAALPLHVSETIAATSFLPPPVAQQDSAVNLNAPGSPDGVNTPKQLPDWQKAIVDSFLEGKVAPAAAGGKRTRSANTRLQTTSTADAAATSTSASAHAALSYHHPLPPPAPINSTGSPATFLPMPVTGAIRASVTSLPSTAPYPAKPARGRKPKTTQATPVMTQEEVDATLEQQKLRMLQGLTAEAMMPRPDVVATASSTAEVTAAVAAAELKKMHRGFGASANVFNKDGTKAIGPKPVNAAEHQAFCCPWCFIPGKYTPTLRKGPPGIKKVCNACGIFYGKNGILPEDRFQQYAAQVPSSGQHTSDQIPSSTPSSRKPSTVTSSDLFTTTASTAHFGCLTEQDLFKIPACPKRPEGCTIDSTNGTAVAGAFEVVSAPVAEWFAADDAGCHGRSAIEEF